MAKSVVVKSGGTIYPGRNNTTVLAFYDDASLDTTLVGALTRVTVTIGGVTVDSSLYSGLFDLTTGAASAEITLRFGSVVLPTPASGATVTVYTSTYPLGLEYTGVAISTQLPSLPAPVAGTLTSLTFQAGDGTLYTVSVAKDDAGNPYLAIA